MHKFVIVCHMCVTCWRLNHILWVKRCFHLHLFYNTFCLTTGNKSLKLELCIVTCVFWPIPELEVLVRNCRKQKHLQFLHCEVMLYFGSLFVAFLTPIFLLFLLLYFIAFKLFSAKHQVTTVQIHGIELILVSPTTGLWVLQRTKTWHFPR